MRVVALLTLGAACAAGAAALDEKPPVTLYYWGNEADVMSLDMVEDFEAMNGGRIRVIVGQSATVNKTDDPQRLLCGIAGGDPPDVVWFDRFAVGEWAAKGAFMNLQPFLDRDLRERPDDPFTLRPEDFYEPTWAESVYGGDLYAVPTETDNRAMFYNIDYLERHANALIAAGCVDPDDPTKVGPPRTWAQLEAATEILTERDARGKLVRVGFIPNFGNSWLYIYGWLNGGSFLSDDGRTCLLDSKEVVEALAYMTKLYDIMGGAEVVNAFQTSQQGGDLDPFLGGKIAMRIDGDPFMTTIANSRRDMRFAVTLAPAPEGLPRLGWCGGWALVIPQNAEHPEEAWQFIKYMVSKRAARVMYDAMQQNARAGGKVWIPNIHARVDISEWAMETYLYSDPTIDRKFKEAKRVFLEAMPVSKYRPVTPVGQLLWNEQVRAMEEGMYKRYDPDPYENAKIALEIHDKVVQRELDEIHHPPEYPELSFTPIVITYIVLLVVLVAGLFIQAERSSGAKGYFRKEYYAGYAFASPWFLGFLIFGGGPMLFSIFMSFCQYDVFSPPKWLGLKNYIDMFANDPLFYKSLWNTLFMALRVPLGMAISLGIAMLLSYEIRGMSVYRTFFYLPAIVPAVAASILWIWIFNPEEGILNAILEKVGIDGPPWLNSEATSKPALIIMNLWGAGAGMLIWLAGLKGIPSHLYEAAEIDGAGRFRKFWSITLPMLSPYILFNAIIGLIGTFQVFTEAFIMTRGGPVDSTLFYVYHLFNNAFRYMKMGYASALAWVLFVIILALTLLQLYFSRRWVHYESDR